MLVRELRPDTYIYIDDQNGHYIKIVKRSSSDPTEFDIEWISFIGGGKWPPSTGLKVSGDLYFSPGAVDNSKEPPGRPGKTPAPATSGILVRDLQPGMFIALPEGGGHFIEWTQPGLLQGTVSVAWRSVVTDGTWMRTVDTYDPDAIFSRGVHDDSKMPEPSKEMMSDVPHELLYGARNGKMLDLSKPASAKKQRIRENEKSFKCCRCGGDNKLLLTTYYCPRCE